MNEKDMLVEMLHYLKDISLMKYKKLQKLAILYLFEEDSQNKEIAGKKLRKYIYNLYLGCMNKETRREISNTGVLINEECYTLEQKQENKGWRIAFDGAYHFEKKDDQYVITDSIPREYNLGFYLNEEFSDKERDFYLRNRSRLERISDYMDRKQELTTYDYQTKNPFIPVGFVELLVDYLELCRIPEDQKYNKK